MKNIFKKIAVTLTITVGMALSTFASNQDEIQISRRIPASFDMILTATINTGNEMIKLQEALEVKGAAYDNIQEIRYIQLLDELDAYNDCIVSMIMDDYRDGSFINMEMLRDCLVDLNIQQRGYFLNAVHTLDEQIKNMDFNGEILMAGSNGIIRDLLGLIYG